jgi:hypothetical protein
MSDEQKITIEDSQAFKDGVKYFDDMSAEAAEMSKKLVSQLTETVIKESDGKSFNLTTAILAAAKSLACLASYLYNSEEEFLRDLQKAREVTTDDVIPALLKESPCGECEKCRSGHPEECTNKKVRADLTTSRFLPILCSMIVEYDFFNKVVFTHIEAASKNEATLDGANEVIYKDEEEVKNGVE